jgi:hypothetical protein
MAFQTNRVAASFLPAAEQEEQDDADADDGGNDGDDL